MNVIFRSALGVMLAASLAACLGAPATEVSAEDRVAERAVARWEALIAGDWQGAYAMLTPGYRAATPFERWRGQFGGAAAWKSVSVQGIICAEQDVCRATLLLDYEVSIPRPGIQKWPGRRPVEETWLLLDGEWWFHPER